MPQLDKYIFFNQIFSLFVCFFLIYRYLFVKALPIFARSLKFRFKRIARITRQKITDKQIKADSVECYIDMSKHSIELLTNLAFTELKQRKIYNNLRFLLNQLYFNLKNFELSQEKYLLNLAYFYRNILGDYQLVFVLTWSNFAFNGYNYFDKVKSEDLRFLK